MSRCVDAVCVKSRGVLRTFVGTSPPFANALWLHGLLMLQFETLNLLGQSKYFSDPGVPIHTENPQIITKHVLISASWFHLRRDSESQGVSAQFHFEKSSQF